MSDSDSSDDEVNNQLLAAVDTSLLSEKLYEKAPVVNGTKKQHPVVKSTLLPCAATHQPVLKSNRYLMEEDPYFHSDLNVTSAVQKHVAEKLSQLIGSVVEFNDSESNEISTRLDSSTNEAGVRLLAGFEVIDLHEEVEVMVNLKPKPIKRRKIDCEQEVVGSADRIAASICDPTAFPKEVQQWKGPRKRSIQYLYKKKQNGSLVEMCNPNEFTKARNANQWDESKIRKFKKCNHNGNAIKTD